MIHVLTPLLEDIVMIKKAIYSSTISVPKATTFVIPEDKLEHTLHLVFSSHTTFHEHIVSGFRLVLVLFYLNCHTFIYI